MRRPGAGCTATLLLLLLMAWSTAKRGAEAFQVPEQELLAAGGRTAAASPPVSSAAACATGYAHLLGVNGSIDSTSGLKQAVLSAGKFQHPLAPLQQVQTRQVEQQAHADMECWLADYFNSSASRLTSVRLQEARASRATVLAEQHAAAASAVADVRAPAGVQHCDAGCLRAAAEEVLLAQEQPGRALQLRWSPFEEDRRRWAPTEAAAEGSDRFSSLDRGRPGQDACQLRQPGETITRDFLVIAAVGNNWATINGWLSQPDSATFDLILLHYGNDSSLECPRCASVLRADGPKWMLVWQLLQHPSWPALATGKRAVMLADDDVVLDTCMINRAFEVFDTHGLLLGQPSLCPTLHRPSWYLHLVRNNDTLLRYVTMVEIMAPMFEMGFFQGFVRPSLHDAYTGWGLDFVWPFLLHYPRDRIAVIDDVCMVHPHQAQQKQGEGSIYAALAKVAPYDAREEEARRDAQFGYYPSEIAALGFGNRPIEVLGYVPKLREAQHQHHQLGDQQLEHEHQRQQNIQRREQQQEQGQEAVIESAAMPPKADPTSDARPRRMQPWLLYSQLSIMLWVVGMLLVLGNRQRRPGSPLPAVLLPGHTKPARILPV